MPKQKADKDKLFLELILAYGDIAKSDASMILIGQFQGSPPSEAWCALDREMGGALGRLSKRSPPPLVRGELDIMPTGRFPIVAENLAFLGLGTMESLSSESLSAAAEAGMRGLLMCRIEEFATVVFGAQTLSRGGKRPAGSEKDVDVKVPLAQMMSGFTAAIVDQPEGKKFRRIILVEEDKARHEKLRVALNELRNDREVFRNIDVRLAYEEFPAPAQVGSGATKNVIRFSASVKDGELSPLEVTLHPAERKAGIPGDVSEAYDQAALQKIYQLAGVADETPGGDPVGVVEEGVRDFPALLKLCRKVTALLPKVVLTELRKAPNIKSPIDICDDNRSASVPWECLMFDPRKRASESNCPALSSGVSRAFVSKPRASILDTATVKGIFKVLIVYDPTEDLLNARAEGDELYDYFSESKWKGLIEVERLKGKQATLENLEKYLNRKQVHLLHYAGHSTYHQGLDSSYSGLILHGEKIFTGEHALKLKRFPSMVVFNSCEAAQVDFVGESSGQPVTQKPSRLLQVKSRTSIAEAFLTARVEHFIGTFWPVADKAALLFCKEFYAQIAGRAKVGEAVRKARLALYQKKFPDWANYIHYGDPNAVVLQ